MTIMLERPPVILCQCVLPCFQPFRTPEGEWSEIGCMQPTGHEGDHTPEGPGAITYREPAQHDGPRVVLHRARIQTTVVGGFDGETLLEARDLWEGQCRRCARAYVIDASVQL